MCQSCLVSIVRFNGKKVVLTGIGSHSQMFQDNKKLLLRRGWKENDPGQSVVSYESNFENLKWGEFILEGGMEQEGDNKTAQEKFKEIAGSASVLIKHIRRIKKIDNTLIDLLTAQGYDKYYADRKPLLDKYNADRKLFDDKYYADLKPLDDKYNADRARAFIKIFRVQKNRRIK